MFDPVQLRTLADRAIAIRDQARAVRDELDAMLPLTLSDEALAAIADWPKPQRECRRQMLHAVLHLGRASLSLVEASDELSVAVVGADI